MSTNSQIEKSKQLKEVNTKYKTYYNNTNQAIPQFTKNNDFKIVNNLNKYNLEFMISENNSILKSKEYPLNPPMTAKFRTVLVVKNKYKYFMNSVDLAYWIERTLILLKYTQKKLTILQKEISQNNIEKLLIILEHIKRHESMSFLNT